MQGFFVGCIVAIASSRPLEKKTTRLLGKNQKTGRFPLWSWILFWPYHTGLRLKLLLEQTCVNDEPVLNELKETQPGWFIGGWPRRPDELPPTPAAVIDVTCELPRTCPKDTPYRCVPTWDTTGPSGLTRINEAIEWAVHQRAMGRNVLIHCAHGHGRSAAVLCAVLVHLGVAESGLEAITLIQRDRPLAKLNSLQRKAVDEIIQHQKKAM